MQGIVIGNFALSFLMSFSMSYLWNLINGLQMIVYLPLLNLVFPANISMVFTIIIQVATFDMIPGIDYINQYIFKFEYVNEMNELPSAGWEALGFETLNFTTNSGSLYMMVCIFLVKTVAAAVLKQLAMRDDNWVEAYRKMQGSSVYQAVAARFILEGFVELFLCSLLNIQTAGKIDVILTNFSDLMSFIMSTFFFFAIMFMPLIIQNVIAKKIDLLE